jgi:type IV pilus assembly protein PilP
VIKKSSPKHRLSARRFPHQANRHLPKKAMIRKQTPPQKLPSQPDSEKQVAALEKRIYDPKKQLNPFIPLFRDDDKQISADQTDKSKRKKRVPQTPLEKISLNQLKLVAIIRTSSGNRALVEDNTGKGFIIKNGTYIGLNSGIVTQINASSIIVEEEIENLMGELILQNTEIKLQKPAGE